MSIDHQTTLIDNYTYLGENVRVSGTILVPHLLQSGVLDEQEVDEIKSKRTEQDKTDALLHCIMRTSARQYRSFLWALIDSDQEFICIKLKQARGKPDLLFIMLILLHLQVCVLRVYIFQL